MKFVIPSTVLLACLGMLGGCATQNLSISEQPAATPVASNEAAAASASAFAEAAATAESHDTTDAPQPVTPAQAPPMYTYDPWEPMNRAIYNFNYRFDEALFFPAANLYRRALPPPVRGSIHHFFGNLSEIDSVINYALQWRLKYGAQSLGRFVINSTIGIGGLFDIASHLKLKEAPTGFSTTLGRWGVHPGPYLVIPLLGPSTLRDGVGYLADYGTLYGINPLNLYRGDVSWALGVVNAVDQRAHIDFRYYSSGSAFEYDTVRFLYVRRRLIEDQALHKTSIRQDLPPGAPAGK